MRAFKLFRITNCFFAVLLFSAGALAAAPEQSPPAEGSSERNPDHQPNMEMKKIGLAIHGGAGTIERSNMTPEREREFRAGLERALTAGYEILKRGSSSLDATEAAVRTLEDDPHFNAGKGSVFTSAGTNEMDAAIMNGSVRIGHMPVFGGATDVKESSCGVSASGDGEDLIRATVGRDVSALMEYRGMSLKDAAQAALDKVAKLGGNGGLIAIDHQGNVTLPFNTSGMYRGYVDANGKFAIEIYR